MKRHTLELQEPMPLVRAVAQAVDVTEDEAREWVQRGAVYLDGRRARSADAQVVAGTRVTVVMEERSPAPAEQQARPSALKVLFEDADVLVVNKPPGVLTQPAPGGRGPSLLELASAHLGHAAGLVHRLDADTSGVVVFGKNAAATAWLSQVFRAGRAEKRYLAATGRGLPARGTIDLRLSKDPNHAKRWRAKAGVKGVEAVTEYRRLSDGDVCLVALFPKTGRTHQLRAHLAALGAPIVGDRLYGGATGPRCLLHAHALRLGRRSFHAPVPEDLAAYFRAAGVEPPR